MKSLSCCTTGVRTYVEFQDRTKLLAIQKGDLATDDRSILNFLREHFPTLLKSSENAEPGHTEPDSLTMEQAFYCLTMK